MFFFFGFPDDYIRPLGISDSERENVRERLNRETNAQGLRNVELADLTGWSTSKVSKATSGKQKLTDDDIRVWARALGFTPSPFLEADYDMRSFKISDHVRSVTECLSAYIDAEIGTPEHDSIINFELPMSILGSLGLNPVDYSVRTQANRVVNDPVMGTTRNEAGFIRIWHRGTFSKDQMAPEIYFGFSPSEQEFAIILYLNRNGSDGVLPILRQTYKDTLQKDEEDLKWFEDFARENKEWLPRSVREGEISSYTSASTDATPDDKLMQQILAQLFKEYYELLWQIRGLDLKPKHFRDAEEEELSAFEQYNILTGNAVFEPSVVEEILKTNQCRCEMDPDHKTFNTENGSQYMEAVPIIPLNYASDYGKKVLKEVNGLCLCPTCRARLIHGKHDDREEMIMTLYSSHRDALKDAGIKITLKELLHMYGL